MSRPTTIKGLTGQQFMTYYWLKADLIVFCRENGLPTTGSKGQLTERIKIYLHTGQIVKPKRSSRARVAKKMPTTFTLETLIGDNWRCSQELRAFFEAEIGPTFHFNKFMRDFIRRDGCGQSLQTAIDGWQLEKQKPKGTSQIEPQFEYNRHMRDYFLQNKGATREEAIRAWKEKKAKPSSGTSC